MKALITGGRDYTNRERIYDILDRVYPTSICHGGASGADRIAEQWAADRGVFCEVFMADWRAFGRKAGMIRNRQMLTSFKPDLVIAFPGGAGTEGMMTLARSAGVKVMQILDVRDPRSASAKNA